MTQNHKFPFSAEFIEQMKQRLLKAKKSLELELATTRAHTEMGSDLDSNAAEVSTDEASQNIIARLDADLEKIKAALEKINSGTYGFDNEGNKISEQRLRTLPWADKAL